MTPTRASPIEEEGASTEDMEGTCEPGAVRFDWQSGDCHWRQWRAGPGHGDGIGRPGGDIVVASRNQEKTQQAVHQIEALGVKALGVYLDVLQPELVEA